MVKIVSRIPESIYKNIKEEIKMGLFSSESEAVAAALKKAYAKKSRNYLRWLMEKEGVSSTAMLKELAKLRG